MRGHGQLTRWARRVGPCAINESTRAVNLPSSQCEEGRGGEEETVVVVVAAVAVHLECIRPVAQEGKRQARAAILRDNLHKGRADASSVYLLAGEAAPIMFCFVEVELTRLN